MSGSRREIWKDILNRFDLELGTPVEWRAEREDSPARDIVRLLDRPTAPPKLLLSGTIGSGKSTELNRVAEARAQKGVEFVIVLDLFRHFEQVVGDLEALQNVTSWEVCFLAGLALIRTAKERLGYDFPPEQVTQLAQAWTELARAAQAAGTTSLQDQDELMQTLVSKVNLLLATFQRWNRRVLLVIDGLDRIVDGDRVQSLFLRSHMIARLDCVLVVCAPFAWRNDMAATEVPGFRLYTLHSVPVLDHRDPKVPGPGVRFLGEVFRRRVHDLGADDLVPPRLLDKLAYYSGGRVRDFVKSIGMLAARGWDDDAEVATDAQVDDVLREARLLVETGLHRGHITVLEEVVRDRDHRVTDGAYARALLTYGRLLAYCNGSGWFYPHPLLTMHMIRA